MIFPSPTRQLAIKPVGGMLILLVIAIAGQVRRRVVLVNR